MTNVEKFFTDVKRIIKNERNSDGVLDLEKCCAKIINFFERQSTVPSSLAGSVATYWKTTYIDKSEEVQNEPTEEHIEILCGFLSFLENTDENYDLISDEDWRELSEFVNCEAETLPLEVLQQLMAVLVEKNAF